MKKVFLNVWQDRNGKYTQEWAVCETIEDAVEAYEDHIGLAHLYLYTLEIGYSEVPVESIVKEIDITRFIDEQTESLEPDYEPLTGHELGVCLGRV